MHIYFYTIEVQIKYLGEVMKGVNKTEHDGSSLMLPVDKAKHQAYWERHSSKQHFECAFLAYNLKISLSPEMFVTGVL